MSGKIPPEVDNALLAGLAARTGELNDAANEIIDSLRLNRLTRFFIIAVSLVLLGTSSVVLYNTITTNKTTHVIRDCTDPGGRCYKDARQSAKDNVKLLNDTTVAAAYCAKQPQNDALEEIRQCIVKVLTTN